MSDESSAIFFDIWRRWALYRSLWLDECLEVCIVNILVLSLTLIVGSWTRVRAHPCPYKRKSAIPVSNCYFFRIYMTTVGLKLYFSERGLYKLDRGANILQFSQCLTKILVILSRWGRLFLIVSNIPCLYIYSLTKIFFFKKTRAESLWIWYDSFAIGISFKHSFLKTKYLILSFTPWLCLLTCKKGKLNCKSCLFWKLVSMLMAHTLRTTTSWK